MVSFCYIMLHICHSAVDEISFFQGREDTQDDVILEGKSLAGLKLTEIVPKERSSLTFSKEKKKKQKLHCLTEANSNQTSL